MGTVKEVSKLFGHPGLVLPLGTVAGGGAQ